MPNQIWGMPFSTFLTLVIISGLIVLFVFLYGILWLMAKSYVKKELRK